MNIYFLVEGKRSERKIYPNWLSVLLPHHSRVFSVQGAVTNNYYLISGEGYPSILGNHLENAVADCNRFESYDYLVLCIDSEDETVADRLYAVEQRLREMKLSLKKAAVRVVVQNRCIETWLLANRKVVTHAPEGRLSRFLSFYNVSAACPECMEKFPGYNTHAAFHGDYLRDLLAAKNIRYTKKFPRDTADPYYVRELLERVNDCPGHLPSFQTLVGFCTEASTRSVGV